MGKNIYNISTEKVIGVTENKQSAIASIHWGYSVGGVGKYGVLLDRAAKRCCIQMHHLCVRGRNWPVDLETLDLLGAVEIIIESRLDLSWIKALGEQLKAIHPAIVMTHGFNGHFAVQLLRVMGYFSGATICSYHGQYHPTSYARQLAAPIFNRFTEWYIRRSLSTVAVAEYTKDYLLARKVEPNRIQVIHNGIEDFHISEAARLAIRNEWGFTNDHVIIGIASRLDPVKGIGYLVSAFERIARLNQHVALVLVGTGKEEGRLRRKVGCSGLDSRVHFAGFRSDAAACISAFDIFALPSLAEYHSIGLLEAMCAGKPIIATDVGGNTESVRDMREALIVPAANVDSLEEALMKLLSDKVLREKLANSARKRYLSEFTEDVMLDKTGAWLVTCIGNVVSN